MANDNFVVLIAGVAQPGMEDYLRSFLQRLAGNHAKTKGVLFIISMNPLTILASL